MSRDIPTPRTERPEIDTGAACTFVDKADEEINSNQIAPQCQTTARCCSTSRAHVPMPIRIVRADTSSIQKYEDSLSSAERREHILRILERVARRLADTAGGC